MHHTQFAHLIAEGGGAGGAVSGIIGLIFFIFIIACQWKIFTKAGKPGWACIVPIYGLIVALDIAGKPWWWLFLLCIPVVGTICAILFLVSFCQAFGKGVGYAIGMIFLGFIFLPMLAFGSAQYQGVRA